MSKGYTAKAYPDYPRDFYDFSKGSPIKSDEINGWIKECIDKLRSGEVKDSTFIGSGNTMVIVFDMEDGYEVIVSSGYQQTTVARPKSRFKKVQAKRRKK